MVEDSNEIDSDDDDDDVSIYLILVLQKINKWKRWKADLGLNVTQDIWPVPKVTIIKKGPQKVTFQKSSTKVPIYIV